MSKKARGMKRMSEGRRVKVKDKCILRYKNAYSRSKDMGGHSHSKV